MLGCTRHLTVLGDGRLHHTLDAVAAQPAVVTAAGRKARSGIRTILEFRTRVVQDGVHPSLHINYKNCRFAHSCPLMHSLIPQGA